MVIKSRARTGATCLIARAAGEAVVKMPANAPGALGLQCTSRQIVQFLG
jgi:hypothetical protein